MIVAVAGLAFALKTLTFGDLATLPQVGPPVVSPDGRRVAFVVTVADPQSNTSNSDVWIAAVDGGEAPRRLTWNPGPDTAPVFSPDGRRLAFVSRRGDGPPQLYVLPLAGGEAERITDLPVGVDDPKWLPDGKRLIFVASTWPDLDADWVAVRKRLEAESKDEVKARASENRLWRFWDHDLTDGRFPHLFAVEIATHAVSDLTPGWRRYMGLRELAGGYDIAPDGKELVVSANATEPPYRTLNYDLFTVKLPGGAPVDVTPGNPADDLRPRYSPDGRFLLYGRHTRAEVDSDFTHLIRRDRRTGKDVEIAHGFDASPSEWTFTPDGGLVYFHAEERGRINVYAVPVAGGKARVVVKGGVTSGIAATRRGTLVFLRQTLQSPPEIVRARPDGLGSAALTTFHDARLAEFDLGRVESMIFPGSSGEDVQMFVVYPPGFDPHATWPLVQLLHGGPFGAWTDGWNGRWNPLLFAARGYVVAMVNFHGSSGRGQAFADAILGAPGDLPFTDVMKATDALIAQGFVDPERLAAAGGSYGGYLAAWILGHTDRFKALVAHAGPYDLMGQFASDGTYGRGASYGAEPWTDPDRIDRWSPSHFATHFTTPTLIVHGERDLRVPSSQGANLYGVLTGKGVPSRIVLFPEEGHWILNPQGARRWYGEVLDWIDRWVRRKN